MATEDKIPNTLPGFSRVFILTSPFRAIVIHPSQNAIRLIDLRNDLSLDTTRLMEENPSNYEVEASVYTLRRLYRLLGRRSRCVVPCAGTGYRCSCSSVGRRPVRIGYGGAAQDSSHGSGARLVASVGDRVPSRWRNADHRAGWTVACFPQRSAGSEADHGRASSANRWQWRIDGCCGAS